MKFKNLFIQSSDDSTTPSNASKTPTTYTNLTSNDKTWGVISHISALLGLLFPFGNVVGPFIVWLFKREDSIFIHRNVVASINFQITISLLITVFYFLFVFIFFNSLEFVFNAFSHLRVYLFAIGLFYLIEFIAVALAIKSASSGKVHKYLFSIPFFSV